MRRIFTHPLTLDGEAAGATTLIRAGYDLLPCKLPSNQGFDHVGIKRNPDGSIKKVLIVESKYNHKGEFKASNTATKGKQMGETWIQKTIAKMRVSKDVTIQETARIIDKNKDKWSLRGNVLDPSGVNFWKTPTHIVNNVDKTNTQPRAPPSPSRK